MQLNKNTRYIIFDLGHLGYSGTGDINGFAHTYRYIGKNWQSKHYSPVVKYQYFTPKEVDYAGPPISYSDMKQLFEDTIGHVTTTLSVFGSDSLERLQFFSDEVFLYDLPFIKIAARSSLYHLIDEIPRKYEVVASAERKSDFNYLGMHYPGIRRMCTVRDYPAAVEEYTERWDLETMVEGISDHTENTELFDLIRPNLYEKHVDSRLLEKRPYALSMIDDSLQRFIKEIP